MVEIIPAGRQRAPKGSILRWAELYGYSPRMVKKFVARGKEVGEAVPFDRPVDMEEWAARHMGGVTKRLKAGIHQAIHGKPTAPAAEVSVPIDLPDVHDSEMGLEAQLSGYQAEFAMLRKMRESSLRTGAFSLADRYFDQMQKISSEIRQLERLLPTVLEQRGDFQRTASVRQATVEFLTVLKRSLLNRASRAGERLRAASSDVEIQSVWKDEIQACFRDCCDRNFAEES